VGTQVSKRLPGFTLVELLMVISMITLLISILIPKLKGAREQAKRIVCQSNMKNINTSLLTYVSEYDTYPVLFKTQPLSWATWNFGGWTGRDFETYCNTEAQGTFCFQTYQRPLSVYMMEPGQILPDEKGADGLFGTPDDRITEMPVFECPSDTISTQWRWAYGTNWSGSDASNAVREMSAYEQCGSSYQMNFYWFYQADARARLVLGSAAFNARARWKEAFKIGRTLWRQADEHGGASRFITLVEDPFDWGIAQDLNQSDNAAAGDDFRHSFCGEQAMGFHGAWSRHMVAFMDGHVEYLQTDTRYQRETDWTVTNDAWRDTRRRENCP